jgi:hypothetical protein
MVRHDPATLAADAASADPARALIERQLEVLTRLTDIGMGIAEDAGRRSRALAEGGEADANAPDPGLTYSRAARAVRMTIALQSRLLEHLAKLDREGRLDRMTETRKRKNRIERLVDLAIEAEYDDSYEVERLSREARERLDDEDEFGDLLDRPLAEVVAIICRDLGLSPEEGAWGAGGADPSIPFEVHPPHGGDRGDVGACFETRPYVRSSA